MHEVDRPPLVHPIDRSDCVPTNVANFALLACAYLKVQC